jgi:hypothetical protein
MLPTDEEKNMVIKENDSEIDGQVPMTSLTLPVSYVDELISIKIISQEPHYVVIRRLLDTSSLTKQSKQKK